MITIKPNELEAVALASSYQQTRYYLNGVCVETYSDGTIGLIATDGHRLHTIAAKQQEQPVSSFILGNIAVEMALTMVKDKQKAIGKSSAMEVLIRIVTEDSINLTVEICVADKEAIGKVSEFTAKAIDGRFPDWRRVIPSMPTDNVENDIAFNCAYMVDFGKASKLLSGLKSSCVKITSTGRASPILVKVGDNTFTGVLMPMRF